MTRGLVRLFCSMFLFAAPALATNYYVRQGGNDNCNGQYDADGTSGNCAKRSVKEGVKLLTPTGRPHTLTIHQGTYFEIDTSPVTVDISNGGASGAVNTIQGAPGEPPPRIEIGPSWGHTVGNSDWIPCSHPSQPCGPGIIDPCEYVQTSPTDIGGSGGSYHAVYGYVAGIPGYENGQLGLIPYKNEHSAYFRSTNETQTAYDSSAVFYIGPGTWQESQTGGKVHITLRKTQDMRNYEARYGQVLSAECADPRNYNIYLSRQTNTLKVTGDYLLFKHLVIGPAIRPVQLGRSDGEQVYVTFDDVEVWEGDKCIAAGNGANDRPTSHVRITNSRMYGNDSYWVTWSDEKEDPQPADAMRNTAIDLRNGAHDWEIDHNHIRGSHDGIGMNNHEYNVVAHHNRIESIKDDAFEIEGAGKCFGGTQDTKPCFDNQCAAGGGVCRASAPVTFLPFIGNLDVYENYITNALQCMAYGQDTYTVSGACTGSGVPCSSSAPCAGSTGPCTSGDMHFYRNTCILGRDAPACRLVNSDCSVRNGPDDNHQFKYGNDHAFKKHNFYAQPDGLPKIFYYHNTVLLLNSGAIGINLVPETPVGNADTRAFSNLLIKGNDLVNELYPQHSGTYVDYDLYFKYNDQVPTPLIGPYFTVLAAKSCPTIECHGVTTNAIPNRGTDPLFFSFHPTFDKTTPGRWKAAVADEFKSVYDFRLKSTSPACNAASPTLSDGKGGTLPDISSNHSSPSTPGTHTTIGHLRCNDANYWNAFPFNAGWAPCGNGVCGADENCDSCPADCGSCPCETVTLQSGVCAMCETSNNYVCGPGTFQLCCPP